MKKKINVIDLDQTLIPYDSFRVLIKEEIKNINLSAIAYTIGRVVKLISAQKYKEKITRLIESTRDELFLKKFAKKLYQDIDIRVLNEVEGETDSNTVNVLLSASPNCYVKYLIEELEWTGAGSYFDQSGNFIHLYGKDKIYWTEKNFDKKKYKYNMAISDSSSDDKLLELFKRKIKWILP